MLKPASIKQYWGEVRPQLERLHEREGKRGFNYWIPEDVYAACQNGQAYFYKSDADTHWCVLRENKTDLGKELYVWIAHSNDHKENLTGDLHEDVIALGEQIGAAYVSFTSTRRAYEKITPAYGWKLDYTKYVYPLQAASP
jgi:hypothetical protein